MESIITTNLKEVTLSSQFLTLRTPKGELEIDIKQLLKEPINSDSAYFNATDVAKMYNKDLSKYFRTDSTKSYIEKRENKINFNYPQKGVIKMVKTVRGKYHSGTWLHSKIVLHFLRWIDIDLEIAMDDFMQNLIIHSNELKIERSNTKIHFKPLTQAIKEIYIPSQESESAKRFAYQNIATLINMKALGMSGTKYRKDNDIDEETDLRDVLDKDTLARIDEVEMDLYGYIKYAVITDYEILKEKINGK